MTMMDIESANRVLNLFGKRIREVPVDEAAQAIKDSPSKQVVAMLPQDDYTDFVLAFLRTLMVTD